jgi:hypothetical protein
LKPPSRASISSATIRLGDAMSSLDRILGDSPLKLLLKLLVVSFLVGLVMSTFGWSPWDIFDNVRDFFVGLYNMGFRAFDRVFGYILLGAAVVIPAYIILRLLNFRR